MSADGAWMVVGAPAPATPAGVGHAFVYERVAAAWTLRATLSGAADTAFGAAVAVSIAADNRVIVTVGAPAFNNAAGQVIIFVQDAVGSADFTLAATRAPTAPVAGDRFGQAVSLSGATLAVGAPFRAGPGEVFIYERALGGADNFGLRTSLAGAESGEQFGASLALNQANLAVGAPFAAGGGRVSLRNVDQGGSNVWGETATLAGSDTASGDQFGASVGLSAARLIVGAPGHNNDAGAAYLFDRTSANAQEAKLTAGAASAAGNAFGSSVAVLNAAEAVVGEPGATITGRNGAGRVHFFARPATTWTAGSVLAAAAPNAAAGLGTSVAIGPNGAAASAPRATAPGAFDLRTGAVLTFTRPAATWAIDQQLQAQLPGPVLNVGQNAGVVLAATGDLLALGAPGDTAYGVGAGAVYLYERDASGAWQPISRLTTSGIRPNAAFGAALAFAGPTTLYVGAPGLPSLIGALADAGAVLRYDLVNNAWVQTRRIEAPAPAADARFGAALAAAGNLLAVGQPGVNQAFVFDTTAYSAIALTPTGAAGDFGAAVALYDPDPATPDDAIAAVGQPALNSAQGRVAVFSGPDFATETLLAAPTPAANDRFGAALAAGPDGILVGAPGRSSNTGAAWIFSGSTYAETTPLAPTTPVAGGAFGTAVALSNGSALIGAPANGVGRAAVFTREAAAWLERGTLTPTAGAPDDSFGAAVAILPGAFLAGAPNHTSAGTADLGAAYAFSITPEVLVNTTAVSVSEAGATATFTVALNQAPPADVTVRLTFDNAQLRAGVGTPTTGPVDLTFTAADWNVAQTVTVAAVDDAIDEADPHTATITLTTTSANTRWNALTVPSVTVSIADNDTAGVTVSATAATVAEGGATDSYTIRLDSQPTANVAVQVAFDDAQLQLNGGGAPLALTFTPANWNVAQTVAVAAVNDRLVEGAQAYTVTHTASSSDGNYDAVAVADVAVAVADDDTAAVSFSVAASNAPEGTTPHVVNAELTLTTSGSGPAQLAQAVSVPVSAAAGTAATPADFTLATASVSFAAGTASAATQPISVAIVNDSLVEGGETFTLSFGTPAGPATASGAHAVTITDNDTAAVSFSSAAGTIAEGATPYSVNAVLTIVSDPPGGTLAAAVTVPVTNAPDTAVTTADYTVTTSSVTFAAGAATDATQPVNVTIADDQLVEGDEMFALGFGAPTRPATATGAHTVTITDNDTATVSFSSATGSVDEDAGSYSGNVVLTLTTSGSGPAELARAVGVAVGDTPATASSPADYTRTTSSVSFAAGTASAATRPVTVDIVDNAVADGDRAFDLTLGAVTGPAVAVAPTTQTVTIVDDDVVGVAVSTSTVTVTEGGDADFTVRLNTQPTADVTVDLAFDDAQVQLNGAGATVTLTFTPADWNTPQTVTVAAVDDQLVEGAHTEAISFTVASSDGAYANFAVAPVTVAITDNDSATIDLTGPSSVDEAGGAYAATLTLTLNTTGSGPAALGIPLTASLAANELTATAGADYTLATPTATFATGAINGATQPVSVAIVDDRQVEGAETFDLQLSGVSAPGAVGAAAALTVTIADNDSAALSFTAPAATVVEDAGTHTATVELSLTTVGSGPAELALPVTAAIVATPGTAASPDDYTLDTTVVSFAAGSGSGATRPASVAIVDDFLVESDETFTLGFGVVTGPASAAGTHVVTIADNDTAGLVIMPGALSVSEAGATAVLSAQLASQPASDVTLELSFDDTQIRLNGVPAPLQLTFTPTNWSDPRTFTVSAVNDALVEGDHSSAISAAISSADPDYNNPTGISLSVAIADNDTADVRFTAPTATVAEDAGTYTATVELRLTIDSAQPSAAGALAEAVTVVITAQDGTAINPADYQLVTNAVTFAAGASNGATQPVTVTIVDNAVVAPDPSFTLGFGAVSGPATAGGTQVVTITNDDVAPPTATTLYIPLVGVVPPTAAYPDLVVQQIAVTNGVLEVTIANTGTAPATAPFWVDLYINPRALPTAVNQIWPTLADRGAAWGVTAPIPAGGSLTLRLGDAFFRPEISNVGGPIAAGTLVAAQVDSANTDTTYGNILEGHEVSGGAYNNVGATTLAAPAAGVSSLQQAPADTPLPPRAPPPGASAQGVTPASRREQI
jgi:hypothetical protein